MKPVKGIEGESIGSELGVGESARWGEGTYKNHQKPKRIFDIKPKSHLHHAMTEILDATVADCNWTLFCSRFPFNFENKI